jgi:hypothetical protein
MPYTLRKVPNKKCYRVTNKKSRRIMAKCTTKTKANKQLRLLRALEYTPGTGTGTGTGTRTGTGTGTGWKPTKK